MKKILIAAVAVSIAGTSSATTTLWDLSSSNFFQDWSDTSLISTTDDWSGVASIMGYRGDNLTAANDVDPQTVLAFEGTVDVNANQTNPNTSTTGGVSEFEIANATVALQGSGTADAPALVFYMNAAGRQNITISYNLRDIDGSADNSIQQVALQYRIGGTGDFINVPGGYVADASSGPNLATLVTPVSASLAAWNNASDLQFRVITTNATGSDEWIGVDDISITSEAVPEPATMAIFGLGALAALRRRKSK